MRAMLAAVALALTLTAAPANAAPTMRPCASEDSHGPCYWDAQARGNHKGSSFWVDSHNRVTVCKKGQRIQHTATAARCR